MNFKLHCEACGATEELEGWNGRMAEALAPELAKVMPVLLELSRAAEQLGMINVDIGPGYVVPVDFIRVHREHVLAGKGAILVMDPEGNAFAPVQAITLVQEARDLARKELLAHVDEVAREDMNGAHWLETVIAKVFGSLER